MDWLYEIFKRMENLLDQEIIEELMCVETEDLYPYHFTLGVWIRNTFLQKDSIAYTSLLQAGITHPEDMSAFIIGEFHACLRNR